MVLLQQTSLLRLSSAVRNKGGNNMHTLRVKDILPALQLARGQRLNIYSSPEGILLKTVFYEAFRRDPEAAVGKSIWKSEVMQLDAVSAAAFNITVKM